MSPRHSMRPRWGPRDRCSRGEQAFGRGRSREGTSGAVGSRAVAGDVRRRLLLTEHAAGIISDVFIRQL